MSKVKSVSELLEEELGARIEEIESADYEYVPKLNKGDAVGIIITSAVCVGIMIGGIL